MGRRKVSKQELIEALVELRDLVTLHNRGQYEIDSFTAQQADSLLIRLKRPFIEEVDYNESN